MGIKDYLKKKNNNKKEKMFQKKRCVKRDKTIRIFPFINDGKVVTAQRER